MDVLDGQLKRLAEMTEELARLCTEVRNPRARALLLQASTRLGFAALGLVTARREKRGELRLVSSTGGVDENVFDVPKHGPKPRSRESHLRH